MGNGGWSGRRLRRAKMMDAVSRRMESVRRLAIGRSHAGEGGVARKGGGGLHQAAERAVSLRQAGGPEMGGWGQRPGERGRRPSARRGSERGGA